MSEANRTLTKTQQAVGLIGWVSAAFAAAALGAIASAGAGTFYAALARPPWAPPAWVFGPVWTALYALMAVAAWLVWRRRGFAGARAALVLFIAQLVANALWSWLFFAWQRGELAFADVSLLWCLLVANVVAFHRVALLAAVLLYPYLAWTTFAVALTYTVWRLNPGLL
jgi:tryptophan-rich sensory protein